MKLLSSLLLLLSTTLYAAGGSATTAQIPVGQTGGAWYDPLTTGQGFELSVGAEGSYLTYYTFEYPTGRQVWFSSNLVTNDTVTPRFALFRVDQGGLQNGTTSAVFAGSVLMAATSCETATFNVVIIDPSIGCSPSIVSPTCAFTIYTNRLTHTTSCGE